MDYELAIISARLSLVLVILASCYYLLRTAFVHLQRRGLRPGAAQRLRQAVAYARISHPYIGPLLVLTAPYHIFVMWQFHPLSLKTALGVAVAAGVLDMLVSGWRLKANPAVMARRIFHRYSLFALAILLVAHRLA
ncbi:MAG: hypothetical protein RIN56_19750 [Sporomusaceae bacterium]|nr:hypothetical protein [Sporomusaceae bacterium]